MKRFTIVHPFYMSFFSKALYRDVARNWKGLCFLYLLSLLALCTIPTVLRIQADMAIFLNTEGREFVKQVPTIIISKGKISIDKPEPYVINDEKTEDPLMIIDTTGSIRSLQGSKAKALLTKTELIVRKEGMKTATFPLSGIDDLLINRGLLYDFMDFLDEWFAVMIYPVALLVSFLYHIIEVLAYAALGLLFARTLHVSLSYRALIRLAVVSISPTLLLGSLLLIVNIVIPSWWLISFWGSLGYLFFAVKANSGEQEITRTV